MMRTAAEVASAMEKLEAIKGRITSYEVVIEHPDGRRYLLRYLVSPSRYGIIKDAMRFHGERILKLIGDDNTFDASHWKQGIRIGGWIVRLTGRTRREAIIEGELPYITDV
jgi:hypothetical protein